MPGARARRSEIGAGLIYREEAARRFERFDQLAEKDSVAEGSLAPTA